MQSHPERIHPLDANKLVAIASATNQLTRLAEDPLPSSVRCCIITHVC